MAINGVEVEKSPVEVEQAEVPFAKGDLPDSAGPDEDGKSRFLEASREPGSVEGADLLTKSVVAREDDAKAKVDATAQAKADNATAKVDDATAKVDDAKAEAAAEQELHAKSAVDAEKAPKDADASKDAYAALTELPYAALTEIPRKNFTMSESDKALADVTSQAQNSLNSVDITCALERAHSLWDNLMDTKSPEFQQLNETFFNEPMRRVLDKAMSILDAIDVKGDVKGRREQMEFFEEMMAMSGKVRKDCLAHINDYRTKRLDEFEGAVDSYNNNIKKVVEGALSLYSQRVTEECEVRRKVLEQRKLEVQTQMELSQQKENAQLQIEKDRHDMDHKNKMREYEVHREEDARSSRNEQQRLEREAKKAAEQRAKMEWAMKQEIQKAQDRHAKELNKLELHSKKIKVAKERETALLAIQQKQRQQAHDMALLELDHREKLGEITRKEQDGLEKQLASEVKIHERQIQDMHREHDGVFFSTKLNTVHPRIDWTSAPPRVIAGTVKVA